MINLLPEKEKKGIRKEYFYRVAAVALGFTLIIIICSIILLAPAFMSVWYKKRAANNQITALDKSETAEHKALVQKIDDLKAAANVVGPDAKEAVPTDIIQIMVNNKTAHNIITSIKYAQGKEGTFNVVVSGIAETRQSLVDFAENLKKDKHLKGVDFPSSNLVRDTNIQFTMTVAGSY